MTVTVKVSNHKALNLLKDLENLGLIHLQYSAESVDENNTDFVQESTPSYNWLRGSCKNHSGSVDEFLAHSHKEKEHEMAIEKRLQEESAHFANKELSS